MDELTRLAGVAPGDPAALERFVALSQGEVWRLCAHLVDRASADDLTQETFLRAIPSLRGFRGESSARTWLLSIARHTCADAIRRKVRQRRVLERLGPTVDETAPADGEVDLDLLVAGLDPERRLAFVLTQVLGLRYAEAAEVCGCPVGTIRSRVARARLDLVAGLGGASEEQVAR